MIKLKRALKSAPKPVNRNPTSQEPLMDTKAEIHGSFFLLNFEEIHFDSFGHFLDKKKKILGFFSLVCAIS